MGRQLPRYGLRKILSAYLCLFLVVLFVTCIALGILTVNNLSGNSEVNVSSQLDNSEIAFTEKVKNADILADIIENLYIKDGVFEVNEAVEKTIKSFIGGNSNIKGCVMVNEDNLMYRYGLRNQEINFVQLNVMCSRNDGSTEDFVWYNMTSNEIDDPDYLYNKFIIAVKTFQGSKAENTIRMYLFLDDKFFSSIIGAQNDESITAVIGPNKTVLYTNNKEKYNNIINSSIENIQKIYSYDNGFYKMKCKGGNYTAAIQSDKDRDFKYVKIYRDAISSRYTVRTEAVIFVSTAFLLLAAYWLYLNFFKSFEMQIAFVSDRMKTFCREDVANKDLHIAPVQIDEVNKIVDGYNAIVDSYNKIMSDVKRAEHDNKRLEINALNNQIKPHFLYNTLNSIRILIMMGEQEKAAESIRLLGRILRTMLSDAEREVTLGEEIGFIESYIELMQIRFENCLNVDYSVDIPSSMCKIPVLVLQPIVENAIEHGLSDKLSVCDDNAKLFISARKTDGSLKIEITDNGVGMTSEKLEEVKKNVKAPTGENIGLYNTYSKLKLLYGDNCKMSIDSKYGLYTTVTIDIFYGEEL